ncbi:MAG: hypothetical protein RL026_1881 [Pseudomonadota bacterium]|jgi:3-deoxy-D-manno-octulosonic-acid transferase
MRRYFYTGLLYLALLPAVCFAAWRGWRNPANRINVAQRLGFCPVATHSRPLWIHAVSVGEVQAAAGLVAEIRRRSPTQPLLLTASSGTGMARARQLFGPDPAVQLCFAPIDLPDALGRFLRRQRPCALVLTESELWPNWIRACRRRQIPVALASGRLSERSARSKAKWVPDLMREAVSSLGFLGAQTAADAARFVAAGAAPTAVTIVGNLKFDAPLPEDLQARSAALALRWGCEGRWTWVAGSTHAAEEEVVLAAHDRLLARWEQRGMQGGRPLLVLAPRLPGRFDSVADVLRRRSLRFRRHSDISGTGGSEPDIWLLDTLGDLQAAYGNAGAAFVGGSLVPVGGHNLLEPAALARPVLAGRQQRNAPDVAAQLLEAGGLVYVDDADTLVAQLDALMQHPDTARRRGEAAQTCWRQHRGAAARCAAAIAPWLAATG